MAMTDPTITTLRLERTDLDALQAVADQRRTSVSRELRRGLRLVLAAEGAEDTARPRTSRRLAEVAS